LALIHGATRVVEATGRSVGRKSEPRLLPYSVALMSYGQTLDISATKAAALGGQKLLLARDGVKNAIDIIQAHVSDFSTARSGRQ